jgi:hypothetical protein
MYWHVGPWRWDTIGQMQCWTPPENCIGAIDLRSIPQQSVAETQDGSGIFLCSERLPSEYELIGTGDWRDLKTSQRLKDRIPRRARTRQPKGDDLLSHILDAVCDGSDPTGDEFAKPLMPDAGMRIVLNVGPFRYEWRTAPWNYHWDKIQDVERASLQSAFDEATSGRMRDKEHHRRILDAMCEKYNLEGVDDWKTLIPVKLRKQINGRLKHETTITDNFNRSNADALGTSAEGWSWTELQGDIDIVSNKARSTSSGGDDQTGIAATDLSSVDHYSQSTVDIGSGDVNPGMVFRKDSSTTRTYYLANANYVTDLCRLFKRVSGTYTGLASSAKTFTAGVGYVLKGQANGSSLAAFVDGALTTTVTDTAITTGTRTGFRSDATLALFCTWDDFSASDLVASGVTYTRIERGIRGVTRGMYTQF